MNRILVTVIASVCLSAQARAFTCDDFKNVIKANLAEGEAYQSQHKSSAGDDAIQCRFVRDTFIPYTERTIVKMNLFAQCPEHKEKVSIAVGKTKGLLESLKAVSRKVCK